MQNIEETPLVVHTDGGARGNPGPAAAGWVVEDAAGKKRFLCGKYLGNATNNQAEYQAIKLALETIKKNYKKGTHAEIFLDSLLATQQLNGLFKVKNPKLRETLLEIRALEASFGALSYHHISREKNAEADRMVNKALDERTSFVKEEKIKKAEK